MRNLIFVTYDSIQNSVFQGQVIEPLLKKPEAQVYVISFERNSISQEIISQVPKNITLKIFRRLPVLGKLSLYPSVYLLKQFLKQFDNYEIIARGPLAGWIVSKVCKKFTLQARGLLAEEYKFTHPPSLIQASHKASPDFELWRGRAWHNWRAKQLFKIEQETYSLNIIIKPVSEALADYLVKTYGTKRENIVIEQDDIPELIKDEQRDTWRLTCRQELNLANNTQIYCYNGAVKSWQCPDLVIEFFVLRQAQDEREGINSFLLVLTQDKQKFLDMLSKSKIPKDKYLVLTVQHKEIYKYLCASDYGLIFRKSDHIVNWVSRPVKAMEYKAAGLKIIHNNTVEWLMQ